ncbi:MAG: SAM-dependent chlorinase/fluorinase [Lentimicrobiaceae bacterium]|jgi:hypothetical protein|nr:SAM-dependent chlorinase/fluorinase [Lentimicrobiaceae bacterium]MBT3453751.1 SAM-dependent chlorinase/fluorinase [Lentimicrobiaceae bacterium]MBT4190124.1 SAM-dependent chlorinase/fluorinase [Lentimicrobiaceae bacterium]MBT4467819.1 SAM-dependent chlorinase/fluorinase [Lentimicrobiaceae bacterium]MBT4801674.1 SAM-dependent chlorinase/fluorinase [Lentimicrobiaceae bacterium]
MMGLITLISDWGTRDYYVSGVKGMIYKSNPDAQIVDITHQIEPFNSSEAAYVMKNAYKSFPDNTIHIIGVNTEESLNHMHIVAYHNKHYFIGTDDGIFSLLFDSKPEKIVELDIPMESSIHTFSSRDRFAKAAALLSKGTNMEELGPIRNELVNKMHFNPVIQEGLLKGMIIYIDNYENLITNISIDDFKKFTSGRQFVISFRNQKYKVTKIHDSYGDVNPGDIVALFTSNDALEIAINKGKAASLLGISVSDPITISHL